MATKVIYFTVDGKNEQAEFRCDDHSDDLKETFRSAAEAGPHDILKLYNTKGNLVNISPRLPENTPQTRYKLEVVATKCTDTPKGAEYGIDFTAIENRLGKLEKKVYVENGEMPSLVLDLKRKVEDFKDKLQNVDHLSWLGLTKEISSGTSLQPFWDKQQSIRKTEEHNRIVLEKFRKMIQVDVTDEVREYLRKPTFDNWQWDDTEMLILLRQMYIDLKLVSNLNIEQLLLHGYLDLNETLNTGSLYEVVRPILGVWCPKTLQLQLSQQYIFTFDSKVNENSAFALSKMPVLHQWLYEVYRNYNQVPFHNFKHCFMVAQMMYGLTWLIDLPSLLDDIDIFILLTSAICHDLDHPGYNNAYQINAKTELALRYNDISPLENHHCSVGFEILEKRHCNIMRNFSKEQYKRVREGMIRCILATDMAKHNEILNNFKSCTPSFDFNNKEHKGLMTMILMKVSDISNEARPMDVAMPWLDCLLMEFFNQLLMVLLKIADISNECRPLDVAEPWLECLLQEFFNQSDIEKLEGLPVAPFMDREQVTKSSSQIGFIKFALLPLFEALGQLFPVIENDIIEPVRTALEYYTDMQRALEEEKKKKDSEGTKNGIKKSTSQNKVPV